MQDVVAKVGLNNACILMTSVILLFIIYSESTFSFLCSVAGLKFVYWICSVYMHMYILQESFASCGFEHADRYVSRALSFLSFLANSINGRKLR